MTKKPLKYPNAQSRYTYLLSEVDRLNGALSSGHRVYDNDGLIIHQDSRFVVQHVDYILYIGIKHPAYQTIHLCGLQYTKGVGNIRHPTIHLFDGYTIWECVRKLGDPK